MILVGIDKQKNVPVYKQICLGIKRMNDVFKTNGELALQYGTAQGYEPLRCTLATQLNKHNIAVNPDELMITNGAQEAISLLTRVLVGNDSAILTEDPGYSNAHLLGIVVPGLKVFP